MSSSKLSRLPTTEILLMDSPAKRRPPNAAEVQAFVSRAQDVLAVIVGKKVKSDVFYEILSDRRWLTRAAREQLQKIVNNPQPKNRVLISLRHEAKTMLSSPVLIDECVSHIQDALDRHDYQWSQATLIKAGKRNIWIRTLQDQILERAIVMILGPMVEPHLHEQNFGWREKRSALMALAAVKEALASGRYSCVLRTDIENCFPSVPHKGVMEAIPSVIEDEPFRGLIRDLITAQAGLEAVGLLPGAVSSPLLTNMFLTGMDSLISSSSISGTSLGQTMCNTPLVQAAHRTTKGPIAPMYFRYCDDIVVLVEGDRALAHLHKQIVRWLAKNGMKLSAVKTHVGSVNEPFDFVGFTVHATEGASPSVVVGITKRKQDELAGQLRALYKRSTSPIYRSRCWRKFQSTHLRYFIKGGAKLPAGFKSEIVQQLDASNNRKRKPKWRRRANEITRRVEDEAFAWLEMRGHIWQGPGKSILAAPPSSRR